MDRIGSAIIDFTEAAYSLELSDEEWLPALLECGLPVLDHGLGVAGMRYGRPPEEGPFQLLDIHVAAGQADFADRHRRAMSRTPLINSVSKCARAAQEPHPSTAGTTPHSSSTTPRT